MSAEEWRPVVGWPEYAVSNLGRVVSYKGRSPKLLSPYLNGAYPTVTLHDRHVGKLLRTVHSLVLEAFVGPRPAGLEIRHLNGNPLDSTLPNLCYGTKAENMQDSLAHGTHPQASKTHCPQRHEYTPENTYVIPSSGARTCRTCKRIRDREYEIRRAQRAAAVPTAA